MKRLSSTINKVSTENPVEIDTKFIIEDYMLTDPEFEGFPNMALQRELYSYIAKGKIFIGNSILEYECGRGDFGAFLIGIEDADIVYTGFTSNPIKYEVAMKKYGNSEFFNIHNKNYDQFVKSEFTDKNKFDWVVNSWSFIINENIFIESSEEFVYNEFMKYINECLYISIIGVVSILPKTKMNVILKVLEDLNLKYVIDRSVYDDLYKLTIFNN